MTNKNLSVVIPTYNEAGTIETLIERIINSLQSAKLSYEIILVDDYSSDTTREIINKLSQKYPISLYLKKGAKGKAHSLLQGMNQAQGEYIAMIDGDLQYPPEVIPEMYALAQKSGMVVANRKVYKSKSFRRFASRANAFIFGRLLFGFNCDVQSGLKVFKKEIIGHLEKSLFSAWSIDIPLLYTARELGFQIKSVDITYEKRKKGESKISFLQTAWQIATGAIKLKLRRKRIYQLAPVNGDSMLGAGFALNRQRYVTHTTLHSSSSAVFTLKPWQKFAIVALILSIVVWFAISPLPAAIFLVAVLSTIYFIDVFFNLYLIGKSLKIQNNIESSSSELADIDDNSLPIYSIICPLYREAHILPQFLKALDKLDWPKNKLDVIILLEEDDAETIKVASRLSPSYVRSVIVPNSYPKTKPKACNYGLTLVRGQYVVIYDVEDIPDPMQLKKAFLAFSKVNPDVICLQAKLNYYNPHHNLLTRLFTAEYSLWFDLILPGLQRIETSIPLGGTSNHFRTSDLIKLKGWDTFNVTEDCDLGMRLFKEGYKTSIIDSTTYEEANSNFINWIRQRSRWIKGYIQTYFVHMRNPGNFVKKQGKHAFIFQLVVGGKIAFMLINPLLWLATISYFAAYRIVGPLIESIYPVSIFYMAATSLIFGNFLYVYYYMIGCAKRNHWDVIKYVFFVPFYWLMISIGAAVALIQLIFKPHYWEKTHHGYHLGLPLAKVVAAGSSQIPIFTKRTQISRLRSFAAAGLYSASTLVAAAVFGNFFNFVYNAYLGRSITVEEFGTVTLFSSFFYLSTIVTSAIGSTISFRSAYLLGKYQTAVKDFWATCRKYAVSLALIIAGIWILSIPIQANFFHTSNVLPFILFTPVWIVGIIGAVDAGFLNGNLLFIPLALIIIVESIAKLAITIVLVDLNLAHLVYAAIPASMTISFLIGWFMAKSLPATSIKIDMREVLRFPKRFFATSVATKISTVAFLSLDVILVKHFLSAVEAGNYSLLSLVGKIVFFVGVLFSQFINPFVSRQEGAGLNSKNIFYKLLFATILSSGAAFILLGIFGFITIPILFGQKAASIISLVPIYTLAMCYFTVANSIVIYHQVKKHYSFPIASLGVTFLLIFGISAFHSDISVVNQVMLLTSILYFMFISFLHLFYKPVSLFFKNATDFLGLFTSLPQDKYTINGSLRILIFNWRDTKHAWAGGAEVYIQELAKRWVETGHKVTIFCGNDGKHSRNQVIDGVQIVRRGGFYTVYIWAFLYYVLRFKGLFDVIIDSENGVPFFTPLFSRKPKFLLIHHVHQNVFQEHLRFPLSSLAKFIESVLMPLVYKNTKIITISQSSKKDIIALGLGKDGNIEVIPPGVNHNLFRPAAKTSYPSFVYLGRLKPYKNVDVIIKALDKVRLDYPKVKLSIAGEGESDRYLKQLTAKLNLNSHVEFSGYITEAEKAKLLARSWVALQPSSIEGWGITVIEANASATPVIASNVAGLRESVLYRKTGLLVPPKQVGAFAAAMSSLIYLNVYRNVLSKRATAWALKFRWEESADLFLKLIKYELSQSKSYSYLAKVVIAKN